VLPKFTASIGLVGVDFHSGGARLLQVREQGEALHIVGAGEFALPMNPQTFQYDPAALTERLRAAFGSGGFTGRRCAVSLPHGAIKTSAVRLPSMPDEELRQAVLWEASQRFGMDRAQMQVDFIRTGAPAKPGENREELVLIAAPLGVIRACMDPLLDAGLRPVAVDTDFSAAARQFSRRHRREADRGHIRAVLHLEQEDSTLMLLRGDQLALCKSISIGHAQMDQAVAEHLQMDPTAASELRAARLAAAWSKEPAEAADPATERAIYEALRPLMGDLVKEVTLCLRYYGVTFRGSPPQSIILCGRGLEPKLEQMCAAACKIPIVHDDPPGTLTQLGDDVRAVLNRDPGPSSAWAVASGLSLRGISKIKQSRRSGDPPPVTEDAGTKVAA
jgi:type IV pilus assembly protein PilM